jgi:adenosylhomocysteine nucleosidase
MTAICGLEAEARLLRPLGIEAKVTGGDAARGRAAAEWAVAEGGRARVSFGIAGGLAPGLAGGTLLLPRAVRSASGDVFPVDEALHAEFAKALRQAGLYFIEDEMLGLDQIAITRATKAALYAQSGAVAVDTESLFVARAAYLARVPFLVLRAVSDPAEISLPQATSVGLDEDGNPAILPVLLSLLKNPLQLPGLIRAARDATRALKALEAARDAVATVFSVTHLPATIRAALDADLAPAALEAAPDAAGAV